MRDIRAIIEAHRENVAFNEKLNKVTNKHSYKKHVKKLIHRMDNPITMEDIEAIIRKEEKSVFNVSKFNWFKFKKRRLNLLRIRGKLHL